MRRWSAVLCLAPLLACSRELLELKTTQESTPPMVDAFSPAAGLVGQTAIRIEGRNFDSDVKVFFGTVEAIWAVGDGYEFSDTVLHAIPAFGSPAESEVRVRGAAGEGVASQRLLVFGREPTIEELSSERVSRLSELVVRGQSFNVDDERASLVIGSTELVAPTITPDRISVDLRATAAFEAIGHGWKMLRYRYTPFVPGGVDEATKPVYVVQRPVLLRAGGRLADDGMALRVYAGSSIELEVANLDDYCGPTCLADDNRVLVGGEEVEIDEARYDFESGVYTLAFTVPALPVQFQAPIVVLNSAGSSADKSRATLEVMAPGSLRASASLAGCAPVAVGGLEMEAFVGSSAPAQRLAAGVMGSEGEVLVATDVRANVNQVLASTQLPGVPTPMVVLASTNVQVSYGDSAVLAIVGDATVGASQWAMVLIYRDAVRVEPLSVGPSNRGAVRVGNVDPAAPNTVPLIFNDGSADIVAVITVPTAVDFASGPVVVGTIALPTGSVVDVQLIDEGAFVYVGVAATAALRTYRMPAGSPRTATLLGTVPAFRALGVGRTYASSDFGFALLDAENPGAPGDRPSVTVVDPTPYAVSLSFDLGAGIGPDSREARLVNSTWWWVPGSGNALGYAIESVGAPPRAVALAVSPSWIVFDPFGALVGAGSLGVAPAFASISDGAGWGATAVLETTVRAVGSYATSGPRFLFDNERFVDVYSSDDYVRFAVDRGTVARRPYGAVAQQVVVSGNSAMVRAAYSADDDPDTHAPGTYVGKFSVYDERVTLDYADDLVAVGGGSTPIHIAAAPNLCSSVEDRTLVVAYEASGSGSGIEQTLTVSQTSYYGPPCEFARVTAALPASAASDFDRARVLTGEALRVDLQFVPLDGGVVVACGYGAVRAILVVRGEYWNDVYSLELPASDGSCPAPVSVASLLAVDASAGRISGAATDAFGRVLVLARQHGASATARLVAFDLLGTPPLAGQVLQTNSEPRFVATNGHGLYWLNEGGRYFMDTLVRSSAGAFSREEGRQGFPLECWGPCELLLVSRDQRELFIGERTGGPLPIYGRVHRLDAATGVVKDTYAVPGRYILSASQSDDGTSVYLTATSGSFGETATMLTRSVAELCTVR